MGTLPFLELNPAALPVGMRVGSWQVKGFRGRGTYGTVYRAVRVRDEGDGEIVALKLALRPGDERFEREAELLSRIRHPSVPRLLQSGRWRHPLGATYPYLAMEWVEGVALYEWARACNPSSRQALLRLAQVARALEATHKAGGVHRDVKGDNVLVRLEDGRAILTDFGAGHHARAETLTWQCLPPGTPAYRSPEACAFADRYSRHPAARYRAHPADDVFALGVSAYRLVTGEYPPSTHPHQEGAGVWLPGGTGPRSPLSLNPRVEPRLNTLILKMLSVQSEARGSASELAEALEQAVAQAGLEADTPLCAWRPKQRASEPSVEIVAEPLGFEEEPPPVAYAPQASPLARVPAPGWVNSLAGALLGGLIAGVIARGLPQAGPERAAVAAEQPPSAEGEESRDGGAAGLADTALASVVGEPKAPTSLETISLPLPEEPFRNQRRAPHCRPPLEVSIMGGCWIRLGDVKPPCGDMGYEWKGSCYLPSYTAPRSPTSDKP